VEERERVEYKQVGRNTKGKITREDTINKEDRSLNGLKEGEEGKLIQ